MISRTTENERQADAPQPIYLNKEERCRGVYSPETLGKVLAGLHQDGLVLLKDVVDVEHIQAINSNMCIEADKMRADPLKQYNHGQKCQSWAKEIELPAQC